MTEPGYESQIRVAGRNSLFWKEKDVVFTLLKLNSAISESSDQKDIVKKLPM